MVEMPCTAHSLRGLYIFVVHKIDASESNSLFTSKVGDEYFEWLVFSQTVYRSWSCLSLIIGDEIHTKVLKALSLRLFLGSKQRYKNNSQVQVETLFCALNANSVQFRFPFA